MVNNTEISPSTITADLRQLIGDCELLNAIGIGPDTDFFGIPNLVPLLIEATEFAESSHWAPSESWSIWREQLTELKSHLDAHRERYRPLVKKGRGNNPFSGNLGLWPLPELLAQTPSHESLESLVQLLKTAATYKVARNLLISRQFLISLRQSIAGFGKAPLLHSIALSIETAGETHQTWNVSKHAKRLISANSSEAKKNFLNSIVDLLNIEIDNPHHLRTSILAEGGHFNSAEPDEQPSFEGTLFTVEDTGIDPSQNGGVSTEQQILLKTCLEELVDEHSNEGELNRATEARVRQSQYWQSSIDQHVHYAWNALNDIELEYLVDLVESVNRDDGAELNDKIASAAILLSLVTGQSIQRIAGFTFGPNGDINASGIYLRYHEPPPNSYDPPTAAKSFLSPSINTLELNLPNLINRLISRFEHSNPAIKSSHSYTFAKLFGRNTEDIEKAGHEFLKTHRNATGYRLTPNRIRSALRQQLSEMNIGKFAIYLITAAPHEAPPIDSYYVALTSEQLQQHYDKAVSALLGKLDS